LTYSLTNFTLPWSADFTEATNVVLLSATRYKTSTNPQNFVFIGYCENRWRGPLKLGACGLIEMERLVKSTNTQFKVFFVDDYGNFYFGGGYQTDIDTLLGQGFEHG
jgi:hypothetical protein